MKCSVHVLPVDGDRYHIIMWHNRHKAESTVLENVGIKTQAGCDPGICQQTSTHAKHHCSTNKNCLTSKCLVDQNSNQSPTIFIIDLGLLLFFLKQKG